MTHHIQTVRQPVSRPRHRLGSRPRLERLEPRWVLSAGQELGVATAGFHAAAMLQPAGPEADAPAPVSPYLTVLATEPANGTTTSAQVSALTLTFDRPLDPSFLNNDILLLKLDENGSPTSVLDNGPATTENLDETGTRLEVALNQTLTPGHYLLFLSPASSLLDSTDTVSFSPDAFDQPLADFELMPPGVTVHDAKPVGTPGPIMRPTELAGSLDLAANPNAVALYQVTVPRGHFWRLGAEVVAQRQDSTLDAALALFDQNGQLIATDEFGRADAPNDPYLFAGLPAGIYYIGVSGRGNLPGGEGGYDLAQGAAGTVPQTQPGGAFTLRLALDPADQPVAVRTLTVDHADPLAATPTGLTLAFSGSLQLPNDAAALATRLNGGIEVLDQNGRAWPLFVSGYSEANARMSYVFKQAIPPGQYTVHLAEPNGLVDLAGHAPQAPGLPAGVLGRFTVAPDHAGHAASDFGPLWPSAVQQGVNGYVAINPGSALDYRFAVMVPGWYTITTHFGASPVTLQLAGPAGRTQGLDPAALGQPNGGLLYLAAGVYRLQVSPAGNEPVVGGWMIKLPQFAPEALLQNGVGQGPALNLALIAPQALGPGGMGGNGGATDGGTGAGDAGTAPTVIVSNAAGPNAPGFSLPPLALFLSPDMIGRPDRASEHVAAVGPGRLALAANGALPAVYRGNKRHRSLLPDSFEEEHTPARGRRESAYVEAEPGQGDLIAPEIVTNGEPSAIDPEWLDRAGTMLAQTVDSFLAEENEPILEPDADGRIVLLPPNTGAEQPLTHEGDRVEVASLGSPITAGVVAAAILHHYRERLGHWLRKHTRHAAAKRGTETFVPQHPACRPLHG